MPDDFEQRIRGYATRSGDGQPVLDHVRGVGGHTVKPSHAGLRSTCLEVGIRG